MIVFQPTVQGLFQGFRLARMLAARDLRNRYATSFAGMGWSIGVPLLYSLINVVVFSMLMSGRMGQRYHDVPFALFYFVPFTLWTLTAEVVGRSPSVLREYAFLINKIAFPSWVIPLVPLASALLGQLVMATVTIGLLIYFKLMPAATVVYLPILWLLSVAITLGMAYAVASLSVYVPDLAQATPVALTVVFWLTPILYPATLVEQNGPLWVRRLVMDFNPFHYLAEYSRQAVFGGEIGILMLLSLTVFSVAVLVAGVLLFRKLSPGFADVI